MAGWKLNYDYPSPYPVGLNPSVSFSWTPWHSGQQVHHLAVQGGRDLDGSPLYVGRTFYNGDQLPAKVAPSKGCAYISWDGKEYQVQSCELMLQHSGNLSWLATNGRIIPHIAVPIGRTQTGETLFVGRYFHNGSLCIGKVHPSHECCYIPFGGKEHCSKQFEILVKM